MQYISDIFRNPASYISLSIYWKYRTIIGLILLFLLIEWSGRENQYAIEKMALKWPRLCRYGFYYSIIIAILWFKGTNQTFIYFQF